MNSQTSSIKGLALQIALTVTGVFGAPGSAGQQIKPHFFYSFGQSLGLQEHRDWEIRLSGLKNSGGGRYLQNDASKINQINSFAKRYVSEMQSVPMEFEKTFEKHFWDILA